MTFQNIICYECIDYVIKVLLGIRVYSLIIQINCCPIVDGSFPIVVDGGCPLYPKEGHSNETCEPPRAEAAAQAATTLGDSKQCKPGAMVYSKKTIALDTDSLRNNLARVLVITRLLFTKHTVSRRRFLTSTN